MRPKLRVVFIVLFVAVSVAEVTIVVLATAMPVQLVSIEKTLIAVLTSRMALKRKIVFVPVAFVKRQLFSIVMFSLVGEQFEVF